ncbi:MAG: alpha/beta fold hydrolase [Sporichthyaceae bacterium]
MRPSISRPPSLFDFTRTSVRTSEVEIAVRSAGSGPPVLLLHGYPQTGAMWEHIAPTLAQHYTVVVPDLRGYGASGKPSGRPGGELYSKRVMASDQVQVMAALGFPSFAVVGHDRGGRVGHRMALDHPDQVTALAVLDIVPTLQVFRTADEVMARVYFHWFFLSQPYDLPERLIGADPEFFARWCLQGWSAASSFSAAAMAEYIAAFTEPATVHATCEDYRAGAGVDLTHDEADLDSRVQCPVLALWGEAGFVGRRYDVLASWRARALDVRGHSVPGGHFVPEEAPAETLAALQEFLAPGPA